MIRLPISKLEPGMVLAAPIPHPADPTRILLNADHRFDSITLRQLARWPVSTVWVRHPGFEFLDERLNSAIPQFRVRLYESIKRSFTGIASRVTGSFNLLEYRNLVSSMILSMVTEKDHAVWAERIMHGETELFGHSANVAYLSLVIGLRLKRYIGSERRYIKGAQSEDLTNLGIGAMFHDFGKLGLNRKLQRRHQVERSDHEPDYLDHPLVGYQALQGRLEATAAAIVLHHHQRYDGNGWPQLQSKFEDREQKRFAGSEIHIFARVVAVANALEALTQSCQKRSQPTIAALAALRKPPLTGMFDPVVLRAAMKSIPPFPLGSYVTLSDTREAVVTDLNSKTPWRPKVRVVEKSRGTQRAGEEIDLDRSGAPSIEKEAGCDVKPYIAFFDNLTVEELEPNAEQAG